MNKLLNLESSQVNVINNLLEKKYSKERIEALINNNVLKVYQITEINELVAFYCKRIDSRDITSNIINNIDKSISDYIIELGKEKCNNVLVSFENNLLVEIINDSIFNNKLEVTCHSYYMDNECIYSINNSTIGFDAPSYLRDTRCFNKELNLSFEEAMSKLEVMLNIEENRLYYNFNKEHECYYIYLDKNLIGIWNQKLIQDFLDESNDIYNSEHHSELDCFDCIHENPCKYADENTSFERELISDKLNLPIFSIMSLCNALENITIIEKD